MPLITVFTPAYNRAHLLTRLYESLCRQTFADFEWLVVDDGSTDGTEELFNSKFKIQNSKFVVRYFRKENGGKHTAINEGLRLAKGELFFIVDSDDYLPENSLSTLYKYYEQIKDDDRFVGVGGEISNDKGEIISQGIDEATDARTVEMMYRIHSKGDFAEAYKTEMFRKEPFPVFDGEKFCPEVLEWARLTRNRKVRFFPEVIYHRNYLIGGLTDNIVKIRMKSPIGSMLTYKELSDYDIPFIYKLKNGINYWRFRFCYKGDDDIPKLKWWLNITAPLGLTFHILDMKKVRK